MTSERGLYVTAINEAPVGPSPGRRTLLLAAAATGAAVAATAGADRAVAVVPTTGSAYTTNTQTWMLARRATSGATPWLVGSMTTTGRTAWLTQQLSPSTINDSTFDALATRFGSQSAPIWWVRDQLESGKMDGWQRKLSIQCEHVARMLWSQRQIQALMTDFWANHINVAVLSDDIEASRGHYQHALRTRALGRFADLLPAATLHPAMLTFLSNRSSRLDHPNENQGRELLELHTLGVGNYGETDVLNATRVLTGLSVDNESGEFEYKPWYHWTGAVTVLGWSHPNTSQTGGLDVANSLLAYLARHPATAQRICTKLAQYFVADSPPAALVSRMTSTYLANDTAVAPVLRLMFTSPEFAASYGAVTRRPLESVLATVRALGLGIDAEGYEGVKVLVYAMGDAGQSPMNWPTPDGYPLAPAAWGSTSAVLQRWNFTRSLVSGWWPTTLTRRTTLLQRVHPGPLPPTHGQLVDNVALALFGRTLPSAHQAAVLTFLGTTASSAVTTTSASVTWRLTEWVSLLLDSPYHVYR